MPDLTERLRYELEGDSRELQTSLKKAQQEAKKADGIITKSFSNIGNIAKRYEPQVKSFGQRLSETNDRALKRSGKLIAFAITLKNVVSALIKPFTAVIGLFRSAPPKLENTTAAIGETSAEMETLDEKSKGVASSLGSFLQGELQEKAAEATGELGEVSKSLATLSDDLDDAEDESSGLIAKLAALTAAAAAAGIAFVALGTRAALSAKKTADEAGVSVSNLSTLQAAFQSAGRSPEVLDRALVTLNENLRSTNLETSETGRALAALGIDAKDAEGKIKDPIAILKEAADIFAKSRDGANKTAAAVALLGDEVEDSVKFLNQGSESIERAQARARAFGLEISENTAEQAEQFNEALKSITGQFEALAKAPQNFLASKALPYLRDVAETMENASSEGEQLRGVFAGLERAFELVTGAPTREDPFGLQEAQNEVQNARQALAELQADVEKRAAAGVKPGEVFSDLFERFQGIAMPMMTDEEAIRAAEAEVTRAIDRLDRATDAANAANQRRSAAEVAALETEEAARKKTASLEQAKAAVANLEKELALIGAVTKADQVRVEIEAGAYEKLDEATQKRLFDLATEIDERQKLVETARAEEEAAAKAAEAANKRAEEEAKRREGARKRLEETGQAAILALERQIALTGKSTELEKVRFELEQGRYRLLEQGQKAELERLARQLDLIKQRTEAEKEQAKKAEEAARARAAEDKRLAEEAKKIKAESLTLAEQLAAAEERLILLREKGLLTEQEYQTALTTTRERFAELARKANESTDQIAQFGKGAAKSLEGNFEQFLFDPTKEGFEGMLSAWVDTLNKMAANALTKNIFGALFGGASGGAGGLGSLLGFAEGGEVRGPGTATSDSIPAWLSDGEFVVKASAVKAVGTRFLEALNSSRLGSFGAFRSIPMPRAPRFAEGGLASAASTGGGVNLKIVNQVDPSLYYEALESPKGERVVLNILQRRSAEAKKVLA